MRFKFIGHHFSIFKIFNHYFHYFLGFGGSRVPLGPTRPSRMGPRSILPNLEVKESAPESELKPCLVVQSRGNTHDNELVTVV